MLSDFLLFSYMPRPVKAARAERAPRCNSGWGYFFKGGGRFGQS